MTDLRSALLDFARQAESESEAAHDLWTWLPSYRVATAAHGEYAINHRPSLVEILREATAVLVKVHGGDDDFPFAQCPCDASECTLASSPNEDLFSFAAYLEEFGSRRGRV